MLFFFRKVSWLSRQFRKPTQVISVRDYDDYYRRKFTTTTTANGHAGGSGGGDLISGSEDRCHDECSCCNLPPWAVSSSPSHVLSAGAVTDSSAVLVRRAASPGPKTTTTADLSFDSYRSRGFLTAANLSHNTRRHSGRRPHHANGGLRITTTTQVFSVDDNKRPLQTTVNYNQHFTNHRRKSVY